MKKQTTPETPYTVPKVSTSDPNDWYVHYRFFHEGKWSKTLKTREGINRIKDLGKRKIEAEGLRQAREDWFKMGWNPILDPEFRLRKIKAKSANKTLLLNDALDEALSKKSIKGSSAGNYKNVLEFVKEIASKNAYSLMPVAEMDRGMFLDLIDECAKERNFSNHNYNKYVGVLRSMLSTLLNYRYINSNPLLDFQDKIVPESKLFDSYTDEEKDKISQHLLKVHPQLFKVMSVVYHTGIRPQEVLQLMVRDIDMEAGIITIAQEADNLEKSKTTNVRKVPINPHLYNELKEMNLRDFPGNYFVFGTPLLRGGGCPMRHNGKRVYGGMRPDYLTPNKNHVKRDSITGLWKKLIQDPPPTGLGIKKKLYGAKYTGTDDKVDEGLELKEVQHLYGHTSEAMTKRYNKRKRQIEAKKEILEKSPAFSKEKLRKVI